MGGLPWASEVQGSGGTPTGRFPIFSTRRGDGSAAIGAIFP